MTTVDIGKGATYQLNTRELDRILKNLPMKRDEIIQRTAFEIEANAKNLAPVDTGALRSSLFTKTKKSNGYTKSISDAQSKNPKVSSVPETEFGLQDPNGALIGSSMEYAFYVELGHHKVRARPFLGTAVEMQRTRFEKIMKELVI